MLKAALKAALNAFGFEIHRKTPVSRNPSMVSALAHVKRLGLAPAVVIDVGVADGTPALYAAFPDARLMLVEPLEEFLPYLKRIVRAHKDAQYILAAAVSTPGPVTINVYPDLVSSWVGDARVSEAPGVVTRTVPGVALDVLCKERDLGGPYVVKIDAEGRELDVLAGARCILPETEYVILETALFEFNKGQSQFCDVVSYMQGAGFVPYDIFGFQYRPFDAALAHIDIAFVKKDGRFRARQVYATDRQRLDQNKQFQKRFGNSSCQARSGIIQ